MIKLYHGIYAGKEVMPVAAHFKPYLHKKFLKIKAKFGFEYTEFTFAVNEDTGTSIIAIPYPPDYFLLKNAEEICTGRLLRMDGLKAGREAYDPVPEYIQLKRGEKNADV